MFKLIVIVSAIVAGAVISTALAVTPHSLGPSDVAPRTQIDPTALTLQVRHLPALEVDRAF